MCKGGHVFHVGGGLGFNDSLNEWVEEIWEKFFQQGEEAPKNLPKMRFG